MLFLQMVFFFYDFIFHKFEIRTVLLEVGIVLGLLKKTLLKTSKIVLMYSNLLTRHFSSMFHAKCLLPRLDRLLLVRSCLQNFYQCTNLNWIKSYNKILVKSVFFLAWKYIILGAFCRSVFWHLRRKPAVVFPKWLFFQNYLVISWGT